MVKQPGLADTSVASSTMSLEGSKQAEAELEPVVVELSSGRKWSLLAILCFAQFMDIVSFAGVLTIASRIAADLHVSSANVTWILTAYAMSFSSFLLFFGRVSDLYSPSKTFCLGFALLGVFSLALSFTAEQFGFYVLRALSGIAGAASIPSAFRLIVQIFNDKVQQQRALTFFALSGAVGAVLGLTISGAFQVGRSNWRWFFRFIAISCIPFSALGWYLLPRKISRPVIAVDGAKWKRLDLVGSLVMLAAIMLLILGLTQGTSLGFNKAAFIAPTVLSVAMFAAFFVWEAWIPATHALIRPATWRLPNFALLIILALFPYAYWSTIQAQYLLYFEQVSGYSPIQSAVNILPLCIVALIVGVFLPHYPRVFNYNRYCIPVGLVIALGGLVILIFSHGAHGTDYWRYAFPGFCLTAGMQVVFLCINVAVIQSVPAEEAGVASAALQTAFQVGSVVGLSAQAGFNTVGDGIHDWRSSQAGWWFIVGVGAVWTIGFLVLYRPPKNIQTDPEGVPIH